MFGQKVRLYDLGILAILTKMSKAIAMVFGEKLIDFDCRLKSDENEPFLAKK